MPEILIVSDASWVQDEVGSVLAGPDTTVHAIRSGQQVRPAIEEIEPALVILDQQIGSMGGFAACFDLRLEEGAGRAKHTNVLILLDRRADVFMARRCGADGWVMKPLDPIRVRRAVTAIMAGRRYEDLSYLPNPVVVLPASDTLAGTGK